QWDRIVAAGLDSYVGKTVFGVSLTAESLLGGAHMLGVQAVGDYLHYGNDAVDANNMAVSTYLGLFAGAPVYYDSTGGYPNTGEDYISVPRPDLVNPGPVTRIDNVVLGTAGNDKLVGTTGNDKLDGAGGNDLFDGGLGD